MPTYEYQCPRCEQVVDVIHSISEIDNPSPETIKEITCTCIADTPAARIRMVRAYISAPGISTMTKKRIYDDKSSMQKMKKDRKKRSIEHFKKEVYPTIKDKQVKEHFAKKHKLKT